MNSAVYNVTGVAGDTATAADYKQMSNHKALDSNSKKTKHAKNGSVVSLGMKQGSNSSRIMTKDDIIAANVEQLQIRES